VGATKGTKDTKLKNTKTMPLDAPPKAAACGMRAQRHEPGRSSLGSCLAIAFHTRPACVQAGPSSGHLFVRFVLFNFVVFVLFVAPDLRALGRERSE